MAQGAEDQLLKNIIRESGLPLKIFARATELGSKDALNWWVGDKKVIIKDKQIFNFESYFGLLINNNNPEIVSLLRKRMFGDFHYLPEKYYFSAKSKARSSFYIVRYLELLYGKVFVDKLLCSMSVHPRFFEDLNRDINLIFLNDLLMKCEELGFKEEDFKRIAQSMFLSIDNTFIEKEFLKCTSHFSFFMTLSGLIKHFDTNFVYDFIPMKNGIEMISRVCPEINETLLESNQNIDKVLHYRPLLFSQIPKLSKLSGLGVTVKACQSRGDRFSRFQSYFPKGHLSSV